MNRQSNITTAFFLAATLALPSAARAKAPYDRTVDTGDKLVKAFDEADADPSHSYTFRLVQYGSYTITRSLKLTKGYVNLIGASSLQSSKYYVIDANNGPFSVIDVEAAPNQSPLLELIGLVIRGSNDRGIETMGGGGIRLGYGEVDVTDCAIQNNKSGGQGAGIWVGPGGYLNVTHSEIHDNASSQDPGQCGGVTSIGGGAALMNGSYATISHSSIYANKACKGGGLAVWGGALRMFDTTLSINEGYQDGGAMDIWQLSGAYVELQGNTIVDNTAGTHIGVTSEPRQGGGITYREGSRTVPPTVFLGGNVIAQNKTSIVSDSATPGNDCNYLVTAGSNVPVYPNYRVTFNFVGHEGNCVFLGAVQNSGFVGKSPAQDVNHPLKPLLNSANVFTFPSRQYRPMPTSQLLGGYHWYPNSELAGSPCSSDDENLDTRYAAPYTCDIGAIEGTGH